MSDNNTALILDIQRMSTEDGPGLRTTVFFKGCTLKCSWCHNPESISCTPSVQFQKERCIGCYTCINECPNKALYMSDTGIKFDFDKCKSCYDCAEVCPTGAIIVKGKRYTVDELFKELIKDKAYFGEGGGVTLSGGEVLIQANFAADLLKRLREANIDTAVDTAGYVPYQAIEAVLPYTDHLLYDIKIMDPEKHKFYTGGDNKLILENLVKAAETGVKIWIRTPIIPDATDNEQNIIRIAEFINRNLNNKIERWELCAFNNLCKSKYEMLDKIWEFKEAKLMGKQKMNGLLSLAKDVLINKDIVSCTGVTE